jgi:hypothetical protein
VSLDGATSRSKDDVHLGYYPHTANKCNQVYVGVVYSLGWAWYELEHRYQKGLNNRMLEYITRDEDSNITWKLRRIVSHKVPKQGSQYDLLIEWENG